MNNSSTTNNGITQKKIQKNIWKRWNKYRVIKQVRGVTIAQSFNKLSEARKFLKTLY